MANQNEPETAPLLGSEEIHELLLHLLTNPQLFDAARHNDAALDFDPTETASSAVWSAAVDLDEAGNTTPPFDVRALRSQTSKNLESSGEVDLDDLIDLFGRDLPKWARKEHPDASLLELDDQVSFFDLLAQAEKDSLDEERGRTLLRRFVFERHVAGGIREMLTTHLLPADPTVLKQEFDERFEVVQSLQPKQERSLADKWIEHRQSLKQFRGRQRIGLRTGMTQLDTHTLGLRKLILLAALPGGGKTAYTIAISLGVCEHYEENDAVVVFVSLEMDSDTILSRMECNLADMDFTTMMFGSDSVRYDDSQRTDLQNGSAHLSDEEDESTWFDEDDQRRLCAFARRREQLQLDSRFVLLDRNDINPRDFTQQIVRAVKEAKEAANASRALVVVDYLQVVPVPPDIERQGDLVADRFRVAALQEILASIKTGPLPDCVFAISEARKPNSATQAWGKGMAELMGSARLGYAATAVLLYSPMQQQEITRYYGPMIAPDQEEEARRTARGITPVEIKLVKGRDGMRRGAWGVEFQYMRNIFTEIGQEEDGRESERRNCRQAESNGNGRAPTQVVDDEPRSDQAPRRKKAVRKRATKKVKKRARR